MRTECPRCKNDLVFRPIASLFDKTGETFGLILVCPICNWHDWNKFYDLNEVKKLKEEELNND